ncbi:hypothetical protein KPC83_01575 [Collinsella sp. zg1085]|uniref:hypothetical protein n=1 Tax=Collinsella sp. zg1085 TaxID=2844380 RepID=UPI001C0D6743|nr:hypothetical protein [Collinsella sp. zg1085]QWT17868.1 hypothetical protein KPC83_01575 [Collinsella sp. zg1085]
MRKKHYALISLVCIALHLSLFFYFINVPVVGYDINAYISGNWADISIIGKTVLFISLPVFYTAISSFFFLLIRLAIHKAKGSSLMHAPAPMSTTTTTLSKILFLLYILYFGAQLFLPEAILPYTPQLFTPITLISIVDSLIAILFGFFIALKLTI